jgi:hypothetical protein
MLREKLGNKRILNDDQRRPLAVKDEKPTAIVIK